LISGWPVQLGDSLIVALKNLRAAYSLGCNFTSSGGNAPDAPAAAALDAGLFMRFV
jgi:hypothetical protein